MKELSHMYTQIFNRLLFCFNKVMYEMYNRQSMAMSYECYLINKHPIDRQRMRKAMDELRIKGTSTFYSEVFKEEITLTTSY